ncbi:MAG: hypothetical protein K2M19_07310 [Muribaculaceae bacterium]|nr:hypothetical protein [Muribaculaceae bacterium]
MAKYSSKPTVVNTPAQAVADKFADLSRFQSTLDNIPAEERAKIGDIRLTADSIVMNTPQVGEIVLKVTDRTPSRVALEAVGSPVPMALAVDIEPVDDASSRITTSIDVDVPAMLKPMIGGTLQKAADSFGQLMGRLA